MAESTPLSLDDHLTAFIDAQVRSGRYGSASDVVQARLRLLEQHETKVRALEDALIDGERSGEPQLFEFEEFKARKRLEFGRSGN